MIIWGRILTPPGRCRLRLLPGCILLIVYARGHSVVLLPYLLQLSIIPCSCLRHVGRYRRTVIRWEIRELSRGRTVILRSSVVTTWSLGRVSWCWSWVLLPSSAVRVAVARWRQSTSLRSLVEGLTVLFVIVTRSWRTNRVTRRWNSASGGFLGVLLPTSRVY